MRRPISWRKTTLLLLSTSRLCTESHSFLIEPPGRSFLKAGSSCCSTPRCLQYSPGSLASQNDNESNAIATLTAENSLDEQIQALRNLKQYKHIKEDALSIVPRTSGDSDTYQKDGSEDIVGINTIVLQLHSEDSMETVLVILSETNKIDMRKVLSFWKGKQTSAQRVELAPSDQLQALVGYDPGSIPPIGHMFDSKLVLFPTIIDEDLIQNTPRRILLGGGGSESYRSMVRLPVLVGMDHVEIASIGVGKSSEDEIMEADDEEDTSSTLPQREISLPPWGSTTRPKPLFPLETPDMDHAKALLSQTNPDQLDLPPVDATWVTIVGRIGRVRRKSKRLVFCDLLPLGFDKSSAEKEGNCVADLVADKTFAAEWRSSVDGDDLSVQLLGGSTLCQAMGEVQGQAALKRLQADRIVMIQAKVNAYSTRNSLENWVSDRRLDLNLVSFQILHDSATATSIGPQELKPQSIPPPPTANKPFLKFSDTIPGDSVDTIQVVDDVDSLQLFSEHVAILLDTLEKHPFAVDGYAPTPASTIDGEPNTIESTMKYEVIGLDCEWKPNFYLESPRERQPVLVLQMSVQNRTYIFDMQSLARPFVSADDPMTTEEKAMNDVVEKVFAAKHVFIVGFQLLNDLQKLACSYPNFKAFQLINGVAEISTLAGKVIRSQRQRNSRQITSSLNRLTEHFLDRSVDKQQQVSDWSQRPMTKEQVEYAALDAAVTSKLAKQFFETLEVFVFSPGPVLARWKGDNVFSKILTSYKFLFLEPGSDFHVIKKLKAKAVISGYPLLVVTQTWTTAQDAPNLPSVPDNDTEGPYTDVYGVLQVPSTTVRIRPPTSTEEEQNAFVTSLVGQRSGKSKEKCLLTLLAAALNEDPTILPDDSRLLYPPRSGYIEFEDGVVLFVNMPEKAAGGGQPRSFPNEWLEDGKVLTWFVRDFEWESGTTEFAKKLQDPDSLVVLFVRVMNKNYFLCCGPCQVQEAEVKTEIVSKEKQDRWDLVQLDLKPLEWETLNTTTDFLSLVV